MGIVAPRRTAIGLDAGTGPWRGRTALDAVARQRLVPQTDVPTAGYGIVNLALTHKSAIAGSEALWFVELRSRPSA